MHILEKPELGGLRGPRGPRVLVNQFGNQVYRAAEPVVEGPPSRKWWKRFLRRPRFDPKALGSAPGQTYIGAIAGQPDAGTLFNTYTTAKTVINNDALYPLPANFLRIGSMFRVTVYGALSNIVTTPGTVAFQIMMGSIVAFTTGNIQMNATAHTLFPFFFQVLLTCRAIGSGTAANFMGGGILTGTQFTRTATTVDGWGSNAGFTAIANVSDCCLAVPDLAPAVGTGFDSTVQNLFDFWVGFSISNAGNGVQVQQYLVESLN